MFEFFLLFEKVLEKFRAKIRVLFDDFFVFFVGFSEIIYAFKTSKVCHTVIGGFKFFEFGRQMINSSLDS
jgi:hypothetical protein